MNRSVLSEANVAYREAKKDDILTFLNKECFRGNFWHSCTAIARAIKVSQPLAREILFEMAQEGFLRLRDDDTQNTELLYTLQPNLRQEHRKNG